MKRWSRNEEGNYGELHCGGSGSYLSLSTHQLFLGCSYHFPWSVHTSPGPSSCDSRGRFWFFMSAGAPVFKNSLHPHPNLEGLSFCAGLPAPRGTQAGSSQPGTWRSRKQRMVQGWACDTNRTKECFEGKKKGFPQLRGWKPVYAWHQHSGGTSLIQSQCCCVNPWV